MHVSFIPLDKKKGVDKKLSLIKNARTRSVSRDKALSEENNLRENDFPKVLLFRSLATGNKRPLEDKTDPNNVKLFKTSEGKSAVPSAGQQRIDMLNGYHTESGNSYGGRKGPDSRPPIATLSNLGNTCFLNSILYTLRFTPNFLHNLHHLVGDLAHAEQRLAQTKAKSSSLGRNFANLATSGSRSWSSKDLPSLGGHESTLPKSKTQITTEKMHEMYAGLHAAEMRDCSEPYQAETFLTALRNVNSIFEGNQQQDAHELLMCVLDSIRETCRSLQLRFNHQPEIPNGILSQENLPTVDNDGVSLVSSKTSFGLMRKSWKNKKKAKTSKLDSPTKDINGKPPPIIEEDSTSSNEWCKNVGFDFVADDFEGTTVLRTTCLECEMVTERKQTMSDISVPIPEDKRADSDRTGDPSAVYQNACVTSECLSGQNKYWCDQCARYNEARRQVSYETLPRLVVLQLKRFSGGMEKLTAHMPTPLRLACFCHTCCLQPASERPHQYALYGVIMHLGQTLTGGHYIAYTRANYADYSAPYICCERDSKSYVVSSSSEKSNFMKNLFARNKSNGNSVGDKGQSIKRKVAVAGVGAAVGVGAASDSSPCSSLDCCGIRLGQGTWSPDEMTTFPDQNVWLMCDDETVKPISNEEFDELLSSKPKIRSPSTPYLLFYVKTETEQ